MMTKFISWLQFLARSDVKGISDHGPRYCPHCVSRRTNASRSALDISGDMGLPDPMRRMFERAVLHVRQHAAAINNLPPTIFVSYAWGNAEHELWIRDKLVPDLELSGATLVYDRHENVLVGSNIPAFVDKIAYSDKIIVVGTPLYLSKSNNEYARSGSILALEKNIIYEQIMRGKTERKVLPALLEGDKYEALPPAMWGLVPADFREPENYLQAAFKLILSIYDVPMGTPAIARYHDSLQAIR